MSTAINSQHYTMKLEGVEKSILSFMNQERKTDGVNSCEVLLLANNMKHYAHKIVLTRFSDFFRKYFYENPPVDHGKKARKVSNDECDSYESSKKVIGPALSTIHLPGINSVELEPILEYMYTSTLELKAENVNEILLVACLLQVTSVIEFCAEVLYKQPNWRSPLVSPRILKFVRQDNTSQKDTERFSPTAVTWATNGAKPSSHETRTRRKGRTLTNGLATKHETLRSEVPRQRRDIRSDYNADQHFILKKRCLSNSASYKGSVIGLNPAIKSRHASNTEEKQAFDYSLKIDYDDLDRNMPLIQAGKMRSIFQCQESKPSILLKEKPSFSWDIHSRSIPTKRPVPAYASTQADRESFRRHPASEDFQTTMIPQLIDCRSLWQAAQASALGIPVYPSNYANFRLAQGSETYSKARMDGERHRASDSAAINSNETLPIRQCTASVSTLPRHSQNRSIAMSESHSNVYHNERFRTHGLYHNEVPSKRFLKQDSVDAIDNGTQDSPINLSQSVKLPASNRMGKFPWCESTPVSNEPIVEPSRRIIGRRDFANSKFSCFTKPAKSDEDSGSQEILGQRSGGYIDYHKRKRKLLRGAQDPEVIAAYWAKDGKPEEHSNTRCAKSRKQHCSSEDGIVAKEYNKHHLETTSDSDSDDSGRPCSV